MMTSNWGEPLIIWRVGLLLRDLDKLEKWAERNLLEIQQRQLQNSSPVLEIPHAVEQAGDYS